MSQTVRKLSYQPYSSILNPGFWQSLSDSKIDELKLSTDPVGITGTYSIGLSSDLPCLASFDHEAFSKETRQLPRNTLQLYGQMVCFNFMQEMIDFDKKGFLESIGNDIWEAICDGRALKNPEEHLSRFGLIVYADLKNYKFTYWFTFPAVNYPKDAFYSVLSGRNDSEHDSITRYFNDEALQMIQAQYDRQDDRSFQRGYFILLHDEQTNQIECKPLHDYKQIIERNDKQKLYFAYSDPCPNSEHPGWPLRNFLALIAVQFQLENINVIRIRRAKPTGCYRSDCHHSMVLNVSFQLDDSYKSCDRTLQRPIVTGWERNESQQLAPKRINLSTILDPKSLAEHAANLNLQLMKWRLLPGLDLEAIAHTKCLILGCGTLGCHIARGLVAWGVRHINFVDNSRVSFSNPVRQTLYTFDDCAEKNDSGGRGRYKAQAAAAMIKRIHPIPSIDAHVFSIPMPGHHVVQNDVEQTKKDIEKLEQLIEDHDVIFLLTDTRESRWLPTVIAMSKQKLVINAAIGFDTFLLQRFGVRDYSSNSMEESIDQQPSTSVPSKNSLHQLESSKLGCYFCNDVVAPGDSTIDRTLDQQCTVSRPGVSMMVSALAVEFLASIVTSPQGSRTSAPMEIQTDPSKFTDEESASELGIVPHSLRGNMSRYHIYMPTSPCFNKCSACSSTVIKNYKEKGFEFLLRVFNEPSYLEEITGLKDLKNVSDDVWALDSDEMLFDDCATE